MAVYIDNARNPLGRMIMCHMVADTLDELHAMAKDIGMKREWFQPLSSPHYDVSLSRRKLAIAYGAINVTPRQLVKIIQNNRKKMQTSPLHPPP